MYTALAPCSRHTRINLNQIQSTLYILTSHGGLSRWHSGQNALQNHERSLRCCLHALRLGRWSSRRHSGDTSVPSCNRQPQGSICKSQIKTLISRYHSIDCLKIIPVIASIYNLAAGVMSLCVTFYGMQIGRKGTILLGCLLICIGALLQASCYSVGQIIAGRIVTGAGIGNIAAAVPTYMVCRIC
jgi:hypothetical protein